MSLACEELGLKVEVHHHEVATGGQSRDRHRRGHAGAEGRPGADPQVRRAQRGARLRQDRDLHAQAPGGRQRQRHARAPVAAEGRQGAVRRRQVRRAVGPCALLHRRHHQARQGAQRLHQRGHQQLQAPGAGLRGAGDARLLGAQPLRLDPHPVGLEPQGTPHRGALPGLLRQSLLRLRGDDDGGPRRDPEQDPPGRSGRQGSVRPRARGGQAHPDRVPLPRHGARAPRPGPGVPHPRRRVHQRRDRRLHGAQVPGGAALPHVHASRWSWSCTTAAEVTDDAVAVLAPRRQWRPVPWPRRARWERGAGAGVHRTPSPALVPHCPRGYARS